MAGHKHSFPLKGIEALIQLAEKHNLQSLHVDGIVIIPRPKAVAVSPKNPTPPFTDLDGKPRFPTRRESEEVGLFGLAGALGEIEDSLTDYNDANGEPDEVDEH